MVLDGSRRFLHGFVSKVKCFPVSLVDLINGISYFNFYINIIVKYKDMEPGLSRGPGVEVERAVPDVWCSSRIGSRSGEGVTELKSKRRGRRRAEVEAERTSRC